MGKRFGDWVLTSTDLYYYGGNYKDYPYIIETSRLNEKAGDTLWLDHLRKKKWFNKETEHDFLEAFYNFNISQGK